MTATPLTLKLHELALQQRQEAFVEPEKEDVFEALGVLIAKYCEWESTALKRVVYSMLEDSNFHTLNEQIHEIWGK